MNESPPTTHRTGKHFLLIGWILGLGLLSWAFGLWEDAQINPNQNPNGTENNEYREVILQENRQHHYVATGNINKSEVVFLLDTGASDVVVPTGLASRLQLKRGRPGTAITANGSITVYKTTINELTIGPIRWNNVDASINPGMDGDAVLLGMSALKQVDFSQQNGQLILRQYAGQSL